MCYTKIKLWFTRTWMQHFFFQNYRYLWFKSKNSILKLLTNFIYFTWTFNEAEGGCCIHRCNATELKKSRFLDIFREQWTFIGSKWTTYYMYTMIYYMYIVKYSSKSGKQSRFYDGFTFKLLTYGNVSSLSSKGNLWELLESLIRLIN